MIGERSHTRYLLLFTAGALLLAIVALQIFRIGPPPQIAIRPEMPAIGKRTPVRIEVAEPSRGLSSVTVEFVQGERVEVLAQSSYLYLPAWRFWGPRTERDVLTVEVGGDVLPGLKPGEAIIRVRAGRAGTWLRHPEPAAAEIRLPVYLIPPALQVLSSQTYAAQGGCEAVVYRVGETSQRDGVRAGEWWFPGYPLPGSGRQERFALFAIPYDMDQPEVKLVAIDGAGNEAERTFVDRFIPRPGGSDTLEISDSFIAKVVPEILAQTPQLQDRGSPLDTYLAVNRELRKVNREELKALAAQSKPEFLWNTPFQMMRNAKVMSTFAEHRTYRYQGRVVDHQDHLGYDLASTAHAPVTSANSGIVLLARYFGIYGNAVVVDHGYGLMSLYGHLSSIDVSAGGQVARGDKLGETGQTGLAGGDHLHFTLLLQGLPVNPIEWWDSHWIRDRLARKLGSPLGFQE